MATKQIVGTLPSGPDPELFVLHPSGNPLYIANEDDNLVTVVDINEKKVLAENTMDSSVYSTVITANGVMYVMTRNNLYAIQEGAQRKQP